MNYEQALEYVLRHGKPKGDRTGTGTVSVFGLQIRYNLQEAYPLITSKRVPFKSVIAELLWFLSGSTNVKDLQAMGCTIWDSWRSPWKKERDIVIVAPRVKEYQPAPSEPHRKPDFTNDVDRRLYYSWGKMMDRCYNPAAHNYRFYGGKGVSVALEWHDPKRFIEDVKNLPHWWYKLRDWNRFELDKDYYGARQYGPDACVWLPKDENVPSMYIYIKTPDNQEMIFEGLTRASEVTGIPRSTLHRFIKEGLPTMLKGGNKRLKGWEVSVAYDSSGLIRRELIPDGDMGPIYPAQWRGWGYPMGSAMQEASDQVSALVERLKRDPESRRHLVSAWNVEKLDAMALAPCHHSFQVDVTDGVLSILVNQRSADMFLGVPFNLASYAALAHMLAQQCGYVVGDLIWSGGDCHIYVNHMDQVRQLLRNAEKPVPLPTLKLHKAPSIFTYGLDNFELVGYHPYPAIPAPVAV